MKHQAGRTIVLCLLLLAALPIIRPASIGPPLNIRGEREATLDQEPRMPSANCSYKEDLKYGGTLMDCRGLGISQIMPEWMLQSTTTALFDINKIAQLSMDTFSKAPNIIYLSLRNNSLTAVSGLEAINRLPKLRILDLEGNNVVLNETDWRTPLFRNLTRLEDLRLAFNQNLEGAYPTFLLQGLKSLLYLSLDTFKGVLDFHFIFKNTPKLNTLVLAGECSRISNDSFRYLRNKTLKELHLVYLSHFEQLDLGAFDHLSSLRTLRVNRVDLGIKSFIQSFNPLKLTSLESIEIAHTHCDVMYLFSGRNIIDEHSAKILGSFCLKKLTLVNNCIFFLSREILTGRLVDCLKDVKIHLNPLMGDRTTSMGLMTLPHLESFQISDAKYSLFNHQQNMPVALNQAIKMFSHYHNGRIKSFQNTPIKNASDITMSMMTHSKFPIAESPSQDACQLNISYCEHNICVNISKTLKILRFYGMTHNMVSTHFNYSLIPGNNVKEVNTRDDNIYFYGGQKIKDLRNAEHIDFSYNIGWEITLDMFDCLPLLRHLNLSSFNMNPITMANGSNRLFQRVGKLEVLDISRNHLVSLSPGTFHELRNLRVLILAWNKFNHLPVDLTFLPKLQILDLTENSIETLSTPSMNALDSYAENHKSQLTLKLEGNIFSCRCDNIRFLSWLRRTVVRLDGEGNYTCIDEEGREIFTSSYENLDRRWRQCESWNALMVSLLLACVMALGYTVFFLAIKFKTRIVAFFLTLTQLIHRPANYPIGVFIGYADKDTAFVRFVLAQYIEQRLGFVTYIRHRDLEPGKSMADSIVNAVRNSWRVLIVVSQAFLTQDEWAWFTMQTAIFSVQNTNPGRVVVLVEEAFRHRIPHCLSTAVHEDSIVTLEDRTQLSYEEAQKLKEALNV